MLKQIHIYLNNKNKRAIVEACQTKPNSLSGLYLGLFSVYEPEVRPNPAHLREVHTQGCAGPARLLSIKIRASQFNHQLIEVGPGSPMVKPG